MAFPGQRADAESSNVVIRALDAAVSKVSSFESELPVIGYSFGRLSIDLEIDKSRTVIVVFDLQKNEPNKTHVSFDTNATTIEQRNPSLGTANKLIQPVRFVKAWS